MSHEPRVSVFINCPFDIEYRPLFEAMVFTIVACGYYPRCALEDSNSGDVRLDKLCELIRSSNSAIHDLSRTQLSESLLPRFNMPFELGLVIGAKRFGSGQHKNKRNLVLIEKKFEMPKYLSDLGGNDAVPHENQRDRLITAVRGFLKQYPDGDMLPGAQAIGKNFERFNADLPGLASEANCTEDEVRPFGHYPEYLELVTRFLDKAQAAAALR